MILCIVINIGAKIVFIPTLIAKALIILLSGILSMLTTLGMPVANTTNPALMTTPKKNQTTILGNMPKLVILRRLMHLRRRNHLFSLIIPCGDNDAVSNSIDKNFPTNKNVIPSKHEPAANMGMYWMPKVAVT